MKATLQIDCEQEYRQAPDDFRFLQKLWLLGQPVTTAVISLSANYVLDPSEAASRMQDFLQHTAIVFTPVAAR